ncbi:uncharacterized protein VTP21DRAFT_961 [Calcarisporiella thermophila]|uniref:uncharacterized protein n=1 Tax=Calcarisporiella thermophila TaxID=911321 RepID=UPI003744079D
MSPKTIRKKLVVVGDGGCGKTSLLVVYQKQDFPTDYIPTVFENYIHNLQLDNGKQVELALWDTAGQEDYDRLRPLSYPESDVILICFAVDNHISFTNVLDRWHPEVMHFCENVPKVLVGLKVDLRDDPKRREELAAKGQSMITWEQGESMAKEIKAAQYLECSAKLNLGVSEVIEQAVKITMNWGITKLKRRLCTVL